MSKKTQIIIVTLVLSIFAFLTGRLIWPPNPMSPVPSGIQIPLFVILAAFESVSFGLGVSFLIFGWSLVRKVSGKGDTLTLLSFFSIAWYLINWWVHDNLHQQNGMELNGLLRIEYSFHVTMIIAGTILAYFFLTRVMKVKLR